MPVVTVPQDNYRNDQINQGIQNMLGGIETLEKSKQAEELQRRQQAFQALETYTKAREAGYDVTLDPYLKAAESGDVSGISEALKSAGRTPEYMAKKRKEELELRKLEADIEKAKRTSSEDLTPGQKKLDEAFASGTLEPWMSSGGMAGAEKDIRNLEEAKKILKEGKNISGPLVSLAPDWLRKRINPESMIAEQKVKEVVQRKAREALGAQYTEKEGEQLMARAYDPALSPAENISRVDKFINQMKASAIAKSRASEYFRRTGTLTGYDAGSAPAYEVTQPEGYAQSQQSSGIPGMSNAYAAPVPDLTKMSREEKLRLIRGR